MLVNADSRRIPLRDGSVHCIVTSPPYWNLRDYQEDGQIGLEQTPEEYICNIVLVMREVWRVLRDDGTAWINLGDSYAGSGGSGGDYKGGGKREGQPRVRGTSVKSKRIERGAGRWGGGNCPTPAGLKPKDLVGIPWRVAFALQGDGWYLRSDIVWSKPNGMPEYVLDRPSRSHEYIFLLSKSPRYFYDCEAVREPQTENAHSRGRGDSPKGKTVDHGTNRSNSSFHTSTSHYVVVPGGRNRRSVWTIATAPYRGAHYATYPPALVAPCILSGTSKRGVCPVCGAPWERIIEKPDMSERPTRNAAKQEGQRVHSGFNGYPQSAGQEWQEWRNQHPNKTIGWRASCDCDAGEPVPATVLDPFCGSGTTGEVCRNTGRRFVGLDISLQYLTEQALPRAERKTAPSAVAKLPMFAEM